MRSLPDYTEIANRVGTSRCRGRLESGFRCFKDHQRGEVTLVDATTFADPEPRILATIHWADRRVTRPGIRTFLRLVAYSRLSPEVRQGPSWRREYAIQRSVPQLAATARVRLTASSARLERMALRAMLVNIPTTEPGRNEAFTWVLSQFGSAAPADQ